MVHIRRKHRVRNPHPRTLRLFWTDLTVTPHLPIVLYLAIVGWVTLLTDQRFISSHHPLAHHAPHWLVIGWIAAIAVGGTMAVVGGLIRLTRMESTGLGFLLAGAATYGAGAAYELAFGDGASGVLSGSLAVIVMCLIRMKVLSLARKSERKATKILKDRDECDQ